MTVPVTMGAQSERISMTVPVSMQQADGQWRIDFFMVRQVWRVAPTGAVPVQVVLAG